MNRGCKNWFSCRNFVTLNVSGFTGLANLRRGYLIPWWKNVRNVGYNWRGVCIKDTNEIQPVHIFKKLSYFSSVTLSVSRNHTLAFSTKNEITTLHFSSFPLSLIFIHVLMLIIVIMACSKSAGMKSARKMGGPESQLFKKSFRVTRKSPELGQKNLKLLKGRQTGEMESEREWKRVKNKSSFSYVFPQVSNILLSSNGRAYAQEITRLQKEMQSEMKSRNRPSKLPIFTSINHFFTFSPGFYFPQNKTEHMLCEMPLQAIIFLLPIVYIFELK